MLPSHRRQRFAQSLQVMRKPFACPDHPGADEKGRRHLMPQQDRNGMLIVVQITVIESDCNDGTPGVARHISVNDIGDADHLVVTPEPFHLRVELFDSDRQRISKIVAYAVVEQNHHALAVAPPKVAAFHGAGKANIAPKKSPLASRPYFLPPAGGKAA